jgi:REP-associated tyrosine transposase
VAQPGRNSDVPAVPHVARDTAAGRFHVFTHCVWASSALFRDDVDRLDFLRHLARVTATTRWRCIAFCLMGTHYHLILEVDDGILPVGMHALNLAYARDFNRRHGLRGHVQFRRYGSTRIHGDVQLLTVFSYVVRNPVAAGMCAKPIEWPWSSYPGTIGRSESHSFVDAEPILSCFAWPGVDARAALQAVVDGS